MQEMIGLNATEISQYKQWMLSAFGIHATDIDGWENNLLAGEQKETVLRKILSSKYSKPITYIPHGICDQTCKSPNSHIHIAWNGNVLYCTDFYDFSAGNVRQASVIDIFENELSERYRREIEGEHCVTCKHCSWRRSKSFRL